MVFAEPILTIKKTDCIKDILIPDRWGCFTQTGYDGYDFFTESVCFTFLTASEFPGRHLELEGWRVTTQRHPVS